MLTFLMNTDIKSTLIWQECSESYQREHNSQRIGNACLPVYCLHKLGIFHDALTHAIQRGQDPV